MMGYRTSWMAGDFAIPIIQGVRHLQEGPGSPNVGTSDDFGLGYLKRHDHGSPPWMMTSHTMTIAIHPMFTCMSPVTFLW